jgi:hypothetical protein
VIVYQLLNIIIFIVGLVAVLYLLFRLFAWHQGDARFVIEARKRQPFALKSLPVRLYLKRKFLSRM